MHFAAVWSESLHKASSSLQARVRLTLCSMSDGEIEADDIAEVAAPASSKGKHRHKHKHSKRPKGRRVMQVGAIFLKA